jgi:uncharacterized membrane protein
VSAGIGHNIRRESQARRAKSNQRVLAYTATFAADLAFWGTRQPFWALVAMWALGAGIETAALAAVAGHHLFGNVTAVLLSIASLWLRMSHGAAPAILPWGIVLSLLVVLLLLYTGWKGGELVYGRRVGIQPEASPEKFTG